MRFSIQFCTYRRAHLLERVLEACFEQTAPMDAYEVVVVNDGSPDETADILKRIRPQARCRFVAITRPNGGLAKARNTGLQACTGERIAFIDDDVLPTPSFVAAHLEYDGRYGDVIVRGAVINVASFDRLPPPIWSPANYSANYFWTTNVSVRRRRLEQVGGFDESFTEYGWEDIELGMRLRKLGTRAVFGKDAVAFHYKPPRTSTALDGLLKQVRSQARTAVQLERKHRGWRVALAIGSTRPQRWLGETVVQTQIARLIEPLVAAGGSQLLSPWRRAGAALLAADAYYDELARARRAP